MKVNVVQAAAQTVRRLINELNRQLSGEYECRAEGIARAAEAQMPTAAV